MLTLRTSIGIAVRGANLEFLCLKRGLNGIEAGEHMVLENFHALRPGEAGAAYAAFLNRQGMKAANATVSLARGETLVRIVALPAQAESNLAKAVEYQVDGLHPFEEGGVDYDFAVLHKDATGLQVAVVMIEKKVAQAHYEWFSQAGIAVSGFTASAAAFYGALGAAQKPFILLDGSLGHIELLGVSSTTMVSKEFTSSPEAVEREVELCRAQMRLAPEAQPLMLVTGQNDALPAGATSPASVVNRKQFAVYAAALAGLSPAFPINLLPKERRVFLSPWSSAPTYALAALVALLAIALAARGTIQDRLYLRHLNQEIARLEPKVRYVDKLDTHQHRAVDRLLLLRSQKAETANKLQALVELTRLLPNNLWVQQAEFREGAISIAGVTDSAATLLPLLETSPYFRNAEFLSAINKNAEGKDLFRLRVRVAPLLREAKP